MSAGTHPSAVALVAGGENWPRIFEAVNSLLGSGKRVLIVTETDNAATPLGAFVIPLSKAFDPWFADDLTLETVNHLAAGTGVELTVVEDGASMVGVQARSIRVGIYGSGGAPFNHASIVARCGFPWRFISAPEVLAGHLQDIDVFIMPGGGTRSVMGELEPLGAEGCQAIARFVQHGGLYVGCCAGSYACVVQSATFLQRCPVQTHLQLLNARPAPSDTAKGRFGFFSPGVGIVRVANEQPTHPVMFGMPAEFPIVHYNGPVFEKVDQSTVANASEFVGLATFSGWTDQFTPSERFQGEVVPQEATYLSTSIAARRHAIVAGEYGLGRVVGFGSHPEFGFDPAMLEWGRPARMLVNAILWCSWAPASIDCQRHVPSVSRHAIPPGHSLDAVIAASDALREVIGLLASRSIEPTPPWLRPPYALSTFGRPPAEIWSHAIAELPKLTDEVQTIATMLRQRIRDRGDDLTMWERDALDRVDHLTLDHQPPEWNQDHGYQGAVALIQVATTKCLTAIANWGIDLPTPTGAYDHIDTNPYHLVAASYLGALGQVVGAHQLLRAMVEEWSRAERLPGGQRSEMSA